MSPVVPLDELVCDPALQCRAEMVPEVVEEYAAALRDGVTLPPVIAVRVDGQLLLVDGWHRVHAARAAGLTEYAVIVLEGDRRTAIAEAVRANANHGLRRSRADKRRSVRTLLMDREWCRMSSRQLGELAGTSHAFVSEVRRSYGIEPGTVLTTAIAATIDDDLMGEAWRRFYEGAWPQRIAELAALRRAPSLVELLALEGPPGAQLVRVAELCSVDTWPWPDATEPDRIVRAAKLDTRVALAQALASRLCPADSRADVFEALRTERTLSNLEDNDKGWAGHMWWARECAARVSARPALRDRFDALLRRMQPVAARARSPWDEARAVEAIPQVGAQGAALAALSKDALANIQARNLLPEVRDVVFRRLVAKGACPDPRCGSFTWSAYGGESCVMCRLEPKEWLRRTTTSMRDVAQLVRRPGYGLIIGGVCLDEKAIRILSRLQASTLDELPATLAADVRDWRRDARFELLVDPDAFEQDDDGEVEQDDEEEVDDESAA